MSNEEFLKNLHEMSDEELAGKLESGGKVFAPNPNYVLEAARRLKEKGKRTNFSRFVCESDALYAFMNECQLEDGEDIHTAFERWLFRPIDGMVRLLPNGKKLLDVNYRLERSRNNGQFWGKLFGNETDDRIVIKSRMDVEHSHHPSDWLRIVKTVESVEDEILGNKRKDK